MGLTNAGRLILKPMWHALWHLHWWHVLTQSRHWFSLLPHGLVIALSTTCTQSCGWFANWAFPRSGPAQGKGGRGAQRSAWLAESWRDSWGSERQLLEHQRHLTYFLKAGPELKNQLHVRSQSKTQQIPKSGFHTFPDRSAIKLVIRRRKWISFVGKTLGRVHWVWRTQDSTWKVLSEAQLSEAQLSGYWQIHVWACFSLLTQNLRLCHKLY